MPYLELAPRKAWLIGFTARRHTTLKQYTEQLRFRSKRNVNLCNVKQCVECYLKFVVSYCQPSLTHNNLNNIIPGRHLEVPLAVFLHFWINSCILPPFEHAPTTQGLLLPQYVHNLLTILNPIFMCSKYIISYHVMPPLSEGEGVCVDLYVRPFVGFFCPDSNFAMGF